MEEAKAKYLIEKYKPLFDDIWFECGDGWFNIIEKAAQEINRAGADWIEDPPRASQVKEKYGTLRIYMQSENDEMDKVIRKAEAESSKTCEVCGKPGKLYEINYWARTRCPECYAQEIKK